MFATHDTTSTLEYAVNGEQTTKKFHDSLATEELYLLGKHAASISGGPTQHDGNILSSTDRSSEHRHIDLRFQVGENVDTGRRLTAAQSVAVLVPLVELLLAHDVSMIA